MIAEWRRLALLQREDEVLGAGSRGGERNSCLLGGLQRAGLGGVGHGVAQASFGPALDVLVDGVGIPATVALDAPDLYALTS